MHRHLILVIIISSWRKSRSSTHNTKLAAELPKNRLTHAHIHFSIFTSSTHGRDVRKKHTNVYAGIEQYIATVFLWTDWVFYIKLLRSNMRSLTQEYKKNIFFLLLNHFHLFIHLISLKNLRKLLCDPSKIFFYCWKRVLKKKENSLEIHAKEWSESIIAECCWMSSMIINMITFSFAKSLFRLIVTITLIGMCTLDCLYNSALYGICFLTKKN